MSTVEGIEAFIIEKADSISFEINIDRPSSCLLFEVELVIDLSNGSGFLVNVKMRRNGSCICFGSVVRVLVFFDIGDVQGAHILWIEANHNITRSGER